MRVFVTGGSGFVGRHTIRGLVGQGHTVFAMARSSSSAATVKDLGATPILCSLGSVQVDDLTRHQIEAVVHAAAMAEDWGRYQDYFDANVVGTQQLLDAAKAAWCIHRFVHISSEAVHFDNTDLSSSSSSSSSPFEYVESDPFATQMSLPVHSHKRHRLRL